MILPTIGQSNEKGFTLIELMIVVAIIGILASIAIPQFAAYREKAFCEAAEADIRNFMTAEEGYFATQFTYFPLAATPGAASDPILGYSISEHVTMTANASTTDYDLSASHSNCKGGAPYTVTGSVGIIRRP